MKKDFGRWNKKTKEIAVSKAILATENTALASGAPSMSRVAERYEAGPDTLLSVAGRKWMSSKDARGVENSFEAGGGARTLETWSVKSYLAPCRQRPQSYHYLRDFNFALSRFSIFSDGIHEFSVSASRILRSVSRISSGVEISTMSIKSSSVYLDTNRASATTPRSFPSSITVIEDLFIGNSIPNLVPLSIKARAINNHYV